MSTGLVQPTAERQEAARAELKIVSHSPLVYWWPIWFIGFIMALVTYVQGTTVQFADAQVIIHPSKSLGVIYTTVLLLVIVMTHMTVRGVASLTVIVSILALTLLFAYFGWWDDIYAYVGYLAIYANLGFYVTFSTAVFLIWSLAFFVFDRFDYWIFRPGQMVHVSLLGEGEHAYDTGGISLSKLRSDLFRHWILGMGSGDLHISTTGAKEDTFIVSNVLFIGLKLDRIQQLAAMKPDDASDLPGVPPPA